MKTVIWFSVILLATGCATANRETELQELKDSRPLFDGAEFDVEYTGSFIKDPGFQSERAVRIVDFLDFQWAHDANPPVSAHIKRSGAILEISARSADGKEAARFQNAVSEIVTDGQTIVRRDLSRRIGDEWSSTRFIEHQDFFASASDDLIVRIKRKGVGTSFLYRKELLMFFHKRPNKALVPTVMSVTPAADAPVAPATTVAHL